MNDVDITRTVVVPLETSGRKNEIVDEYIDQWQYYAKQAAALLASYEPDSIGRNASGYDKLKRLRKGRQTNRSSELHSNGLHTACTKAGAAYRSKYGNDHDGENPLGMFGEGSYGGLRDVQVDVEVTTDADGRMAYSISASLFPYEDAVWFRAIGGEYQRDILDEITKDSGKYDHGSAELHRNDRGHDLTAHLTFGWEQPTWEHDEVTRWIGVDINKSPLWVAGIDDDEREFVGSHTKPRTNEYHEAIGHIEDRMDDLRSRGDLDALADLNDRLYNYRRNELDNAAKAITTKAAEHLGTGIAVENLVNVSKASGSGFRNVPAGLFKELLGEHCQKRGIAFKEVKKARTSQRCSDCEEIDGESRITSSRYECRDCGYTIDADVNAAFNISARAAGVW